MTKKDFEAIAAIIKNRLEWADPVEYGVISGIKLTARDMADYFETVNPRFDRDRFIAACGL
jgi:hypothetical protein